MRDFAMIRSGIAIVIMAAMAMALTGCSTPKLVEDVFKKEQGTVRQDGQSYYVISAGLPVYAKASALQRCWDVWPRTKRLPVPAWKKGMPIL